MWYKYTKLNQSILKTYNNGFNNCAIINISKYKPMHDKLIKWKWLIFYLNKKCNLYSKLDPKQLTNFVFVKDIDL